LEKVLRGVAIGAIFLLPFVCLVVASSLFFPYITGKNFAFRILTEIAFGSWLALCFVSKEYRPRRSIVLGALALFTFIILIADLQGVYPFKSLWSNYERMDGWVTLIHLLMYVVVAASVLKTERMWKWLMWTSLGVSIYLTIYGLLQIAGVTALGQGGASGLNARIDATFGNPIYFAVYMLFHVFIAAMLWAQAWVDRGPGKRMNISLIYGAIILGDTFMLLATATRGTILGLIGGSLLAAALVLLQANRSKTAWRAAAAGVVAILLLMGGFWMIRDAAWIQKIGFLNRMATISTTDNTVKARFYNWGMAWKGAQERPLLGWGQENYAIVFDKYYDPRMHGQEPWFDRVHNIVFDWLVAGGFLGLLAYLSVFAATLWVVWRSGAFSVAERALITGLLAGYFIHNFFVFDNVTSYILYGTILAFVIYRHTEHTKTKHMPSVGVLSHSALPFVAIAAVVLVWGGAWLVNGRAMAANRTLLNALATQGDLQKTFDGFKKAIAYGTFGTQEAREQLAQGSSQIAQANVPTEVKQAFYTLASQEMTLQAAESPLDARFPLFLGVLYNAFGDYKNGQIALEKAQELSPAKQSIFFERAQNAELQGQTERSIDLYRQAFELDTALNDPRIVYAAVLIRNSRAAEADAILAPIVPTGQAADQRILASLVTIKDYARIAPIWNAYIAKHPEDVQGFFTLAAVYYQAGDKARAISTLQDAVKVHPEVSGQVTDIIQKIQSGAPVN
ncbi:MAG: O-antigen ligase family protein, partial [Candidatus Pacebacteria bacterium]|nr:O-antigen ligase family protein [Candidatus Paceibacterota bacterium]